MLEGGPAPTVITTEVIIYLVKDRQLVKHTRAVTGEITIGTPLQALLGGVTDAERAAGLSSEVPVSQEPLVVRGGVVAVPVDVDGMSSIAYSQLSCTATAAGLVIAGAKVLPCPS